ncbi:MAG: carbon-nitrogen hydrolase family protein [Defluviitaleaceae bacterium]|nr:carbon-nitrogen hydrolase family protein [Defluviitaleaceae bacterium]
MELKITTAQIPVYSDIQKNMAILKDAVDAAAKDKSDILLTPEGSLSGYTPRFDQNEAEAALSEITAYAKEKKTGLALGTCFFEQDGKCYDELRFYLPDGKYLGAHAKTLLCGTTNGEPEGEINDYGILPLRVFSYMGVTVGGLVCNDMWGNPMCTPMDDPHLTRKLAHMGAKIILHAVNGGRDGGDFSQKTCKMFHEARLLMNARADGIYIATADNAFPLDIGASAPGGVISPDGAWAMRMDSAGIQIKTYAVKI